MWKRRLVIGSLIVLGFVGFGIYWLITRTTLGLILGGSAVPSSTLVNNLSTGYPDMVMTSLAILTNRNDPAGQAQARTLLGSTDDYIWFNAALYLGAINDQQSVPYLIKGLKHPASRAYPDVLRRLQTLTGQNFGMDQAKWIQWWKQNSPNSNFSFAYPSLIQQAAGIQTGSMIIINGVTDPVTISHLGSPIRLIGVRLKAGSHPAQAKLLLEKAMMGQFAEIHRDGNLLTADGEIPALVYWIPDPSNNNPSASAILRQGLGPVPFTQRTSLQGYLLQSPLYDIDLSAVGDAGIRAELQAAAPATRAATDK